MQGAEVEYRFHDVRVDTRAHRVTRAGVELALEPKAYEVLLQLLARPGAVLARDDLLDAVWGHRHVTPGVLNRVIAMLRHELGDDAEHPMTIRTVHGVGYALIAPVTVVAATETPAAHTDIPATTAAEPRVPFAPTVAAQVTPEDVVDTTVAFATQTRRWALVGVGVAALLALVWLRWPGTQAPPATPAAATAESASGSGSATPVSTLAVLPFESTGDDPALREIATGLTDSFGEMLARAAHLRVTSAESTAVAVALDRTPRAVARALSVSHVLDGRLRAVDGATLELELLLFDATKPDPMWSHVVRQARDKPFRMLGPALDAIAASPLRGLDVARADPVLNAALDAQDLYWLGRQRLKDLKPDDWRRALVLFERAIAIDPQFALAFTGISASYRNLTNAGGPLQDGVQGALAAVEHALALDPNLAGAYVEKALISTMQWRAIEGRDAAQRAMELAPNDPDVLLVNGNIETYLGRPRAAYALHLRAQAGNPLAPQPAAWLGQDCLMLGDEPCARAHYEEARRLGGYSALLGDWKQRLNLAFGHVGRAALAEPTEPTYADLYLVLARAQACSMLGLDEEAAHALSRLQTPQSAPPLHLIVNLDRHWRMERWAEALAWAEGAGGMASQEPWRSAWTAQARVLAGDAAAGLRDYDRILADPANRALLTFVLFRTRFGIGQIANWIALRSQAGASYQAELAAMNADLAGMTAGGVDVPAFDYHRAVAALLAGDTAAADARLGRAIERGWLDDVAFATDFVWRDFADAPWLQTRRAQIAARLQSERAHALAAHGGKNAEQ